MYVARVSQDEVKAMRKYGMDSVQLDKLEIQENNETLTVPAIITREAVLDYDGDKVYEPREEVEKATFTAQNAWVVEEHPVEVILTKAKDIRGTVRNPVFVEDRIKADLVFFKNRCPPKYLQDIRDGKARSVSIGFFYELIPESGEFNGQHYDYVKKDVFIDHVAVGNWRGRCSYPACGIGLDRLLGANPYPNEHSCRLRDPEKLDIVGSGERKHNRKTYRVIFGKPKGEKDAGSVEQAYRYPVETWSEAEARKHCNAHGGSFEPTKRKEGSKMVEDELSVEEIKQKIAELSKQRKEIMDKLYPKVELSDEEKQQLQGQLTVIDAELKAYENALAEKIGAGLAQEGEREKLHEAAEARSKKYGIAVKKDGHLTPPEGFPQNEEDYGDPVNYKYPLKPKDRCQNALSRWSQFREEYTQPERNIIYERIVKSTLGYNIAVKYNPDLPEARALPTSIKEKLEGFESAGDMIRRVDALIAELQAT